MPHDNSMDYAILGSPQEVTIVLILNRTRLQKVFFTSYQQIYFKSLARNGMIIEKPFKIWVKCFANFSEQLFNF